MEQRNLSRCGASPFSIFDLPPKLEHIRESKFNEVSSNLTTPWNLTQSDTMLTYSIPGASNKFICNEMYLHFKCKILTDNNQNIPEGQGVSVISAFLNSFQKVVVSINSVEVYSCTNYCYVNYLTTALLLPAAEHERLNDSEHLFLDISPITNIQTNSGWRSRSQIYAGSNLVESFGVLNIPLFNGQRFFPPSTRIDITLYSQSPQFLIQAQAPVAPAAVPPAAQAPAPPMQTWKIEVHKSTLKFQSIEVVDDFLHQHRAIFEKRPAHMLFLDYKTFIVNLKTGSQDVSTPQYQLNAFPRRILIGFVKESSYLGDLLTSPYDFEHFKVNKVKLTVNDLILQQSVDPSEGENQELLFWQHRNLGWKNQEGAFYVSSDTPNTLRNTYVFAFDTTPGMNSHCYEFYSSTPKSAVFNIDVLFKEALSRNVTMIIMCEVDQILRLSHNEDPTIINPISLE